MKPNHQHALKMWTVLVPETLGNLHILTRLSARENLIEFCLRKSFKTYRIAEVQEKNPKISKIKHWVKDLNIMTASQPQK
jgi:hypothetical protein